MSDRGVGPACSSRIGLSLWADVSPRAGGVSTVLIADVGVRVQAEKGGRRLSTVENLKSQLEDSKGNMKTSTAIVRSLGKARVNQPPLSGQLEGHYYGGPPAGVAPLRVPPPTFKKMFNSVFDWPCASRAYL